MRKKYILIPTILLLISSSLFSPSGSASGADLPAERDHVPGQLVIRTKGAPGQAPGKAAAAAQSVNAHASHVYGKLSVLQFDNDAQAQKALLKLRNNPDIEAVSLNYIYSLGPEIEESGRPRSGEVAAEMLDEGYDPLVYIPDDPMGDNQWHLSMIQYFLTDPPEADPPCIVVIDTGVNYNHPDLTGKVYQGHDFIDDPNNLGIDTDGPMDHNGHGTHVAGIAAGNTNNTLGISGVSPNSNILAVRVLDAGGSGSTATVVAGLEWANAATSADCGGQEPKIYNLSLGGPDSDAVNAAISDAVVLNRIVAAAAGNSNRSAKIGNYPGANPDTFTVASTEDNNHRSYFSNYDKPIDPWVHIAAPGSGILSTYFSDYRKLSGTSMATPVIAGAAARVWAKNPTMTALDVQDQLINTAMPAKGFPNNTRVVNLYKALGGTLLTIQGEVVNAGTNKIIKGATVVVKKVGVKTAICNTTTNDAGFYVCDNLPATGKYRVKVSRPGMATFSRVFIVNDDLYNANLALSKVITTPGSWTATILWEGQEPFNAVGKEIDLWFVNTTRPSSPICYSTWRNKMDASPWNLLMSKDSWAFRSKTRMTEAGWVKPSYSGKSIQVWAVLWDHYNWPAKSRITNSNLTAVIYKNNKVVRRMQVPKFPRNRLADHWFLGTINLGAGTWATSNTIKTDAQLPSCVIYQ